MCRLDNKWLRIFDHVAHDAARNPAQGCLSERPRAGENRRAWNRPVNTLGRGPERLQPALVAVRSLGKYDFLAITAGDDKQALAGCGSAVAGGPKLPHVHLVPEVFDLSVPAAECQAALGRIRPSIRQ